uniref:Leucine-rich repeat-containing protein let-4 n=1 Tax=Steinernema glaseri TaxID=37863 RepID=A0A1I7YZ89_9BILA
MAFRPAAPLVLLLAALLHSSAAYCPTFLLNQTACSCSNYIDGAIIRCNGPNGPLIVDELKKTQIEINELALENANIIEISARAFKNLRIKKLVLDNNRIRKIHADAFSGLENTLQDLSISMNRLTKVPSEALIGLRLLSVLTIKCNQIGDLEGSLFKNMPSLIELNLDGNKISKIDGVAFDEVKNSLQSLVLDNNALTEVPAEAIRNLDNLIALHLKNNQITKLDKLQIVNMTSLSLLTLSDNQIASIEKNFVLNSPKITYVYLNNNNIGSLELGTLAQFSEVQTLDLSYNHLAEVTTDMFRSLEHLQHLNLEGNSITDIAPGAFSATPLLLLWLPHNCLTSVTLSTFSGALYLRHISLADNNIRNIQPGSFGYLANLHTLDLSSNKIQVLQSGAITGTDHLTVRLQENPMVCSQDGFHVMNGREAINLTTEPNLVCKTDYTHDMQDVCPKKGKPAPAPICVKSAKYEETTTPATTVTSTEPTTTTEVVTPSQPSTIPGRRMNMQRFWRLSKRPSDTVLPRQRTPTDASGAAPQQVTNLLPSRVEERLKQLRSLPPWLKLNNKAAKQPETMEFNADAAPETVAVVEGAAASASN